MGLCSAPNVVRADRRPCPSGSSHPCREPAGFYEESERALHRARRSGAPLSLLYVDVDDFKQINDSVGHQAGDDLLRVVAQQLSSTRATDMAARLGGDEFVVLMPDTGADAAGEVVGRLQHRIETALAGHWNVTFSMGLVTFVVPPASVEEIIRRADDLMYSVKRDTKNAIRCLVVDGGQPSAALTPAG